MPMVVFSKSNRLMILSRLSQSGLKFAVVGAAALGCVALMPVPEVKAACLGGDGICSTFNPGTASTPTDVGNFNNVVAGTFTKAKVQFNLSNFTGSPFSLTGISIKGDGITGSLSFGNVPFNADGNFETGFVNLTTPISASTVNFSNSSISFTIPGGLINDGAVLEASLQYSPANGSIPASAFSTPAFITTASVPGPLPLVGAGVAFGFSRKLRRRISTTA